MGIKYIGQTYPSDDNPPYLLYFLKVLLVFCGIVY